MAKIKSSLPFTPVDKAKQTIKKLSQDLDQTEAVFNRAWLEAKLHDLRKELE